MRKKITAKRILILGILLIIASLYLFFSSKKNPVQIIAPTPPKRDWQIKSIDTMKYSRDVAAQALNDPNFDSTINTQISDISKTGANFVAIAVPYDEEFVPILERWVRVARLYNLHVWFRGNFSAWEGWFGYDKNLTREQHAQMVSDFIKNHPTLFKNGDAFSACPECENGGAGDPRETGDIQGYRDFMKNEEKICQDEFKKLGKDVTCNLASMNYDVANLVFDKDTAKAMGNLIVIDHYVNTPDKLSQNLDALHQKTGANIMLGEIGVPIPDINGKLTDKEQANWIDKALNLISKKKFVIGVNYWVSTGGSTAIFDDNNKPKPAADVLKKYYSLTTLD